MENGVGGTKIVLLKVSHKTIIDFLLFAFTMHLSYPLFTGLFSIAKDFFICFIGGVYCGSTAAVVVASEGQVNVMDETMSDGHLSYEGKLMHLQMYCSMEN